jgi:outer membrane receptor protein involved in Fe transport
MTPIIRNPIAARFLVPLAALLIPSRFAAQASGSAKPDSVTVLKAVSVTATRSETDVRDVPAPVTVLDAAVLQRRMPASVVDLFRDLPGVDVIGVGPNQLRPAIRGQRGQRILLLEDGLRLGNTRRQQDFGELPGLVDVTALDRVEVVRGPSSVLYGTDAIGGVLNLITAAPSGPVTGSDFSGRIGYRYGDAGSSNRGDARLTWQVGGLSLQAGGSMREAGSYLAPAGSYGDVTLGDNTRVQDSGVEDQTLNGYVGWRTTNGHRVFARAEQYSARDAGFGLIEPSLLGEDARIQIRYPKQDVAKFTAGVSSGILSSALATTASLTAYRTANDREFAQDIWAPFGPGTPPGAGVDVVTRNHTDVTTVGFRAEVARIFSRSILTYGADFFRDDARGRDSSVTTVVGFGPPMTETSTRSQIPNATLSSLGLFLQNDMRLHERFSVIAGGRFQTTDSKPRSTGDGPAPDGARNSTGVYAVNALYRASGRINLVASIGRGFRAPNLVERYFDGPTPEGSAYQSATPDLRPEQSLNVDLGAKFDAPRVSAELFLFQNRISDGIRIAFAGDSVDRLPRYQNVNVTSLRVRGAEASVSMLVADRFTATANWSRLLTKNLSDPALPVGDVFASKANASLAYRAPAGRWWAEYAVRYNGRQRQIVAGSSPVGDELPAFTVHNVRAGLVPWTTRGMRQELGLQVNNLTNELYAEVANAGFFRPEPRRNLVVTITTWF